MKTPIYERKDAQHKWVENFEWKHIKPKTAPPQGGRARSDGYRDSAKSRSRRARRPNARVRYKSEDEDPLGSDSDDDNRNRRSRKGGRRRRRKRSPSESRSHSREGNRKGGDPDGSRGSRRTMFRGGRTSGRG